MEGVGDLILEVQLMVEILNGGLVVRSIAVREERLSEEEEELKKEGGLLTAGSILSL